MLRKRQLLVFVLCTATRIGAKHTLPILDVHGLHVAVLLQCQYDIKRIECLICPTLHVRDGVLGLLTIANRWVLPQKEEYDPFGSLQTAFVQPGYWHIVVATRWVSGHMGIQIRGSLGCTVFEENVENVRRAARSRCSHHVGMFKQIHTKTPQKTLFKLW